MNEDVSVLFLFHIMITDICIFNTKFNKMEEDKNLEQNSDNTNEKLHISDVRSMLIEFGNWLYEDDWREMNDGHTERVVDRFLNSIN